MQNSYSENAVPMSQLFEIFKTKQKIWGKKEASIKSYENLCQRFLDFVGGDTLSSEITSDKFDEYSLMLLNTPTVNDVSRATYLRHARVLVYFGRDNGYISRDLKVIVPKAVAECKIPQSNEEIEKLIIEVDIKNSTFSEYRNWVMVWWILSYGSRSGTIRNLRIKHVIFNTGDVIIPNEKGRTEYILPLTSFMREVLRDYLSYRKPKNEEDFLFPNPYGNQLTENSIRNSFQKYCKKREVKNASIHNLRHYFAREYYLEKKDILMLKIIMGHKDIKTTERYVNLLVGQVFNDYEAGIPATKFIKKKGEKIKLK